MIIIGGESTSDLSDMWALNLNNNTWYQPEINFLQPYTGKRFHTVTAINDH